MSFRKMNKNQYDLKQLLEESGLSQSALAQKLGISRQHLHNIVKLNRKTKYSEQIFECFRQTKSVAPTQSENHLSLKTATQVESLPLIFTDDLIRIYKGEASTNLLNKPFYAKYPFFNFSEEANHFCLRLSELFPQAHLYIALGAFRLALSREFKKDQIVILYLADTQKLVLGRIGINPDTQYKFITNNNTMYPLRNHDILLAECTQIVQVLP